MIDKKHNMTDALEDYLETIYLLVQEHKLARVRDIAKARDVKMGSVTPAMKRLADMGLIEYTRREYIDLTPEGRTIARKILARHDILRRFFLEVLQMSEENAETDACSMEHHLSNEGMDKLTRFFEFLGRCDDGQSSFLNRFHSCSAVQPEISTCKLDCNTNKSRSCKRKGHRHGKEKSLAELQVSETARIARVNATGAIRQRLLDMGMLPDTEVTMERFAPTGDPVWIRMKGFQLSLRKHEAESIMINVS